MEPGSSLHTVLEQLKEENRNRFTFVLARSKCGTNLEALKEIGRSEQWYYQFPKEERDRLERLADQLHYETALRAWYVLEDASEDAARVKVDALTSKDKRLQQQAATEILDRVVGKKPERMEIAGRLSVDGLGALLDKIYGNGNDQS